MKNLIDRSIRLPLLLATVSAVASIYLGFFALDIAGILHAMRWLAIPLLLVAIGLFIFHGYYLLQRHGLAILSLYRNRAFLIAFPIAALGLLINQPIGYKIVMDEVLLANTAHQIYKSSLPFVANEVLPGEDGLTVQRSSLDKRALFYPTLLAGVHHLTGYRTSNGFYLNIALTLIILLVLWGIGYRMGGSRGAIFGIFLIATLPLLGMTGTSGGFETLNLLFILFLFLGVYAVLIRTDSKSISFLTATSVLLAQIRYESVLFILITAAVILLAWWKKQKIILPVTLILAAPLLLNVAWQNEVFNVNPEAYQLKSKPDKEHVFSLQYIPDNLGHALAFFLGAHRSLPNSLPLFIVGFPSLIFLLLKLRTWLGRDSPDPFERSIAIISLGLIFHFFLMMAYFWGQYDDPVIFRLSLPTWLLFWLAASAATPKLLKGRFGTALIGLLILAWTQISLPLLAKHSYSTNQWAPANFEQARRWSAKNSDQRFLFISRYGVFWSLENQSTLDLKRVPENPLMLKRYLETDSFDAILTFRFYVPEGVPFPAPIPKAATQRPEGLITEPFYTWTQPLLGGIEIRKVVGLGPELLQAAKAAEQAEAEAKVKAASASGDAQSKATLSIPTPEPGQPFSEAGNAPLQ